MDAKSRIRYQNDLKRIPERFRFYFPEVPQAGITGLQNLTVYQDSVYGLKWQVLMEISDVLYLQWEKKYRAEALFIDSESTHWLWIPPRFGHNPGYVYPDTVSSPVYPVPCLYIDKVAHDDYHFPEGYTCYLLAAKPDSQVPASWVQGSQDGARLAKYGWAQGLSIGVALRKGNPATALYWIDCW